MSSVDRVVTTAAGIASASSASFAHQLGERFAVLRPRPIGICRAMVGDSAEDAVHGVDLAARRSIHQLRDANAIDGWLTTIALRQGMAAICRRRFLGSIGRFCFRRGGPEVILGCGTSLRAYRRASGLS